MLCVFYCVYEKRLSLIAGIMTVVLETMMGYK